jgi:hypothetical protein
MKQRYAYVILFAVPGFLAALLVALALFGAAAGLLWLYVFGDNPWPAAVSRLLPAVFAAVFLLLWLVTAVTGYKVGRRLEGGGGPAGWHVLASAGLTAFLVLLILLQQWRAGHLGGPSSSVICADFCAARGFAASGLTPADAGPRICSCYGSRGREVLETPLQDIAVEKPD